MKLKPTKCILQYLICVYVYKTGNWREKYYLRLVIFNKTHEDLMGVKFFFIDYGLSYKKILGFNTQ